jgi:hypothetical protein
LWILKHLKIKTQTNYAPEAIDHVHNGRHGTKVSTCCQILLQCVAYAPGLTKPTRKEVVAPTNPRGIPYAPFVDKVEDYVTSRADVEKTLKKFQEMIS